MDSAVVGVGIPVAEGIGIDTEDIGPEEAGVVGVTGGTEELLDKGFAVGFGQVPADFGGRGKPSCDVEVGTTEEGCLVGNWGGVDVECPEALVDVPVDEVVDWPGWKFFKVTGLRDNEPECRNMPAIPGKDSALAGDLPNGDVPMFINPG
jgi:hypothetical protein